MNCLPAHSPGSASSEFHRFKLRLWKQKGRTRRRLHRKYSTLLFVNPKGFPPFLTIPPTEPPHTTNNYLALLLILHDNLFQTFYSTTLRRKKHILTKEASLFIFSKKSQRSRSSFFIYFLDHLSLT